MKPWYATREDIKYSLEITQGAYANAIIDRYLEAESRAIEELLHRRFYPERRTVYRDWPNQDGSNAWRLELGENELVSLESLTAGGTNIPTGNVILRRYDDRSEPPYAAIDIDLSTSSAFQSGDTYQQAIVVTGVFGYSNTATSSAAGTLDSSITDSASSAVIVQSGEPNTIGVGSLLLIGTERVIVTERSMVDSGTNTTAALLANKSDTLVPVGVATDFSIGELILIDAERMRVNDIAGNNLIVTRAFDGSALAAHNTASDVFAQRQYYVQRGALGSTAAAHSNGDAVYLHAYPGPVRTLCIAEVLVALQQIANAYANTIGGGARTASGSSRSAKGPGEGLEALRQRVYWSHGRTQRSRTV